MACIVLFVGRAIQPGSHFIDWRDTWGPSLIGEGFPHKSSPQKSHESNDQYLRSHPARGGEHMFGICTYAWLPPSPAKHNLYPFENWAKYVCSNMSFARKKKIFVKDKYMFCVQDDSGCDVPGQEVEQLILAQDLTQHLSGLKAFLLLLRGKKGAPDLKSHLNPCRCCTFATNTVM